MQHYTHGKELPPPPPPQAEPEHKKNNQHPANAESHEEEKLHLHPKWPEILQVPQAKLLLANHGCIINLIIFGKQITGQAKTPSW